MPIVAKRNITVKKIKISAKITLICYAISFKLIAKFRSIFKVVLKLII